MGKIRSHRGLFGKNYRPYVGSFWKKSREKGCPAHPSALFTPWVVSFTIGRPPPNPINRPLWASSTRTLQNRPFYRLRERKAADPHRAALTHAHTHTLTPRHAHARRHGQRVALHRAYRWIYGGGGRPNYIDSPKDNKT